MQAVAYLFNAVIDLFRIILLISVVMSWLLSFNVINRGNQLVDSIWRAATGLTEPVLGPIRRALPATGGLDLSPIVAFLGASFVQILVNQYFLAPLIRAGL